MGVVDNAKHKAQELTGKGKEKVGEAAGDKDLEAEGKSDKTKGNLKQAGDKIKDAVTD